MAAEEEEQTYMWSHSSDLFLLNRLLPAQCFICIFVKQFITVCQNVYGMQKFMKRYLLIMSSCVCLFTYVYWAVAMHVCG